MTIERGPHGQVQVIDIHEKDELITHTLDILQKQLCPLFPKTYIREQFNKRQLCLDCTGLSPISNFSQDASDWDKPHARIVLKEIIEHLLEALDYCLPLSCCNFSDEYIWIDTETGNIYISYIPILEKNQLYDCRLSSLDINAFEKLLLHPLFSNLIDETTRHSIIDALEHDDEIALQQIATDLTIINLSNQKKVKSISFSLLSLLLLLLSSSILSFSIFFEINELAMRPALGKTGSILLFLTILSLISILYVDRKASSKDNTHQPPTTGHSNANILFSPFNFSLSNYAQNRLEKNLFPAFLIEQGEYGDTPKKNLIKRAIWTNDFLIGSNRYTCDLFLDESSIDEMHARIVRRANNFYLLDLGSKEGCWISHRKLFSHEETILCHNDLIRIGHRYFLFSYLYTTDNAPTDHIRESAGTSNEGATSPPVSL